MEKQSRSEWSGRRTRASHLAERLAAEAADSRLPTPLARIARTRSVRQIEFKPLLVDGSITICEDGFIISLGCKESEVDEFTRNLADDETGKSLPWRTRFTLAHEIAHTFFFDIKCKPPRSTVNYKHRRTLQSLERSCNRAALELLLPETVFANRYADTDFILPSSLRRVCFEAAMSAPALILRFLYLRRSTHPFGVLIAAERSLGGFTVNAISRHPGLKAWFAHLKQGDSVNAIVNDKDFLLNGGAEAELKVRVPDNHNGLVRAFTARCERPGQKGRGAVFMTLDPIRDT